MPGYEAPRPKPAAPRADGTADETAGIDFYKATPESRFTLPRQTTREGYSAMETPLYTTEEGASAEDSARTDTTDTMQPYPLGSDTLGGSPRAAR